VLAALNYLQDASAWEAAYEDDGSDVPARLLETLQALGQILVDMTAEEVAELLARPDEATVVAGEASLTPARKLVAGLGTLGRLAKISEGQRLIVKTQRPL